MALNTNKLVIGKEVVKEETPPPAPKKKVVPAPVSGLNVNNLVVVNKPVTVVPEMPPPSPKPEPVKRVSAFMTDMTTVHKI